MKKVLAFVLMLATVVAVDGCGSSTVKESPSKRAAIQTAPHSITIAFADKMNSQDPDLALNVQELNVEGLTAEGLYEFRYGTASKADPGLALSAAVTRNRLTWTFRLRPHVRFSNGEPLTAHDVAVTLNRDITNKANVWSNFTAPMKSASAPNARTVVLTLHKPYPNIKRILAEPEFTILPANAYKQPSSSSYWNHPITAGPYKIQSWNGGNTAVLVVNPNYWGPKPVIHTIRFTTITDSNTTVAELETGQIDMADELPMASEPTLSARKGIVWKLLGTYGIYGFALNDDEAPFNNVRVRKAINYAINRQEINRLLWRGYGKPISGFWPSTMTGYDSKLPTKQNVTRAKALLRGTPCQNGCNVTISYDPTNGPWAEAGSEIAASELQQIGIHASIMEVDDTTWNDTLGSAQDYQMAFTYMYDFANIPNGMLEYDALPDSFYRAFYSNWNNKKLYKLIAEADETSGAQEVSAIRRVGALFEQDQPFVTVATWTDLWAQRVSKKFIQVEPTEQVEVARQR